MFKIAHNDDGKGKCQSHTVSVFTSDELYTNYDIANIYGYGNTKEEALKDFKEKFKFIMNELRAIETLLLDTPMLEDTMVEVDCLGKEICYSTGGNKNEY